MNRTTPPFRADHVGSLLRPRELIQARADHQQGKISAAELRKVEDESIRTIVRMQEDIGLLGVTDGEHRRASWHMDFLYQLGGVTKIQDNLKVKFNNEQGGIEFTPSALKVTGKLTLDKCIFGEDFRFLKSVVTRGVPKITIPSPSMLTYRGGRNVVDEKAYPDMNEFWSDLARVYAREVQMLSELGCTYLQLDDTSLAYLNDPKQREYVKSMGFDPDNLHHTYIRTINEALKNKPANMTIGTHLCRGNFRSSWVASGGYDHVAEAMFGQLNIDGFFLEYDDERSGGFEPLRFVPRGKYVILGLITSKKAALETKDAIRRRIDEAAKFMPLDQICLSPQCGFSSTVDGNSLTLEEQIAKLKLVVDVAKEVWG